MASPAVFVQLQKKVTTHLSSKNGNCSKTAGKKALISGTAPDLILLLSSIMIVAPITNTIPSRVLGSGAGTNPTLFEQLQKMMSTVGNCLQFSSRLKDLSVQKAEVYSKYIEHFCTLKSFSLDEKGE
jgi:hypothetical protein